MGDQYYGANWDEKRRTVLARDDGRCQSCGRRDDLHIHHVTPLREFDAPEDANYLDNLVTLCADCHNKWEGRDQRPVLADAESGTTVNMVVEQWSFDTVFRHSLSAAFAEMYHRWLKADPFRCSICFYKYDDSDEYYLTYFTKAVQSVVSSDIDWPAGSPFDGREQLEYRKCKRCRNNGYNGTNDLRAERAMNAAVALSDAGYPIDTADVREAYTNPHTIDALPDSFDGASARLAAALAHVRQLPAPPNVAVTFEKAVPECVDWQDDGGHTHEREDWREWYESEMGMDAQ